MIDLRSALPSAFNAMWSRRRRSPSPPRFCNVGGGPGFAHPGWINLEGAPGEANPNPFKLSPDCRFPIATGTMDMVYSSHVLEHLNDDTVARDLAESLRLLKPNGRLVIKIPDYAAIQRAWAANDAAWFSDEKWGFPVVTATFHNRGIRDTLNARAAYIFCGFWNAAYGDLYATYDVNAPGAYNGPPALPDVELGAILAQSPPHRIAADFGPPSCAAIPTPPSITRTHGASRNSSPCCRVTASRSARACPRK